MSQDGARRRGSDGVEGLRMLDGVLHKELQ